MEGVLSVACALSARIPLVIMCYFGSVALACGPQRFADALARLARIKARARGFLYAASSVGTTGEQTTLADSVPHVVRRAKANSPVPVALGFGISTPEHAAQVATAGADGVIVGSRLVRAAAEATDPVASVRALVARFSAALR